MPSEADLRKTQEDIARILSGGFYKGIVEMQTALFQEYLKSGFTRMEALFLIVNMMHAPPGEDNL